jgi:hypothetical protein
MSGRAIAAIGILEDGDGENGPGPQDRDCRAGVGSATELDVHASPQAGKLTPAGRLAKCREVIRMCGPKANGGMGGVGQAAFPSLPGGGGEQVLDDEARGDRVIEHEAATLAGADDADPGVVAISEAEGHLRGGSGVEEASDEHCGHAAQAAEHGRAIGGAEDHLTTPYTDLPELGR